MNGVDFIIRNLSGPYSNGANAQVIYSTVLVETTVKKRKAQEEISVSKYSSWE